MLQGNRVGTPNILTNSIFTTNTSTIPWPPQDFVTANPGVIMSNSAPIMDNGSRLDAWNGPDFSLPDNKCIYVGPSFSVERPSDGDTVAIEIILGAKFITHGHIEIAPMWILHEGLPDLTTFREADGLDFPYQIGPTVKTGIDAPLQVRNCHLITQLVFTPSEVADWNLSHFTGWGLYNSTGAAQLIAAMEVSCGIRQLNNLQQRAARDPKFK